MQFRAVEDRCAVDIRDIPSLYVLKLAGFEVLETDIVALGRKLVGVASYRRGSRLRDAPGEFDCSSLTKYLYAQVGVWIPRRSIQQRNVGTEVDRANVWAGDLIFCSGHIDYYETDPADGVGHVGMTTGEGTVLHAANTRLGIIESSLDDFIGDDDKFRGIRRIIPDPSQTITLQTPAGREVETSDDLRWIALQQLPR